MPSVLLTLGGIIAAYGIAALSIVGLGHWSNCALLVLGSGLIVLSRLWKPLTERFRMAGIIFGVILAVCFLVLAVFEVRVVSFGGQNPPENADWIILLGAKVNESGPSVEYAARIEACAAYLKENPGTRCIASGGKGGDEPQSESSAAKKRLMELGIEEDRILTEDRSTSTKENLAFSRQVLEAAGSDPAADSVVIVSSSFHLFRACRYAAAAGFENVSGLGSCGLPFLLPYYYFREFCAYCVTAVTGDGSF